MKQEVTLNPFIRKYYSEKKTKKPVCCGFCLMFVFLISFSSKHLFMSLNPNNKGNNKNLFQRKACFQECIGVFWQGFGCGVYRVASVRSCWKIPPCAAEPRPADSKVHILLAKARPIRNGGNACVIKYLRRRKKKNVWQL